MTKQEFIQYLSHPENLNGHSIAALEKLVQEYPYFQAGRMLYLKNLHNENSIDYEKNLHITSAYAPSGKVLYNLIKKKVKAKIEVTELVEKEKFVALVEVPKEQTISSAIEKEILPKLESIAILKEERIEAIKEIKEIEKVDEFDELAILEKEMLREAYRTSMTVDLFQEQEEKSQKQKTATPIKQQNLKTENAAYSFTDWMKVVGGKTPEIVVEEKSVFRKNKTSIIDNFLLDQTAKSDPKPKVEFYSAETMAKKSLQDNETFVSETLASIYLKQGNLPKALRAYEILLVKHPEKIHIFAPLLEKIKKLLKDQKNK